MLDTTGRHLALHWASEHLASKHGPRPAQLDGIAVPVLLGGRWSSRAQWVPGLSDHAAILGSLTMSSAATGRRCTPAAVAALPPEAIGELRAAYHTLHHAFGVPFSVPDDTIFPPPALETGEAPPDLPPPASSPPEVAVDPPEFRSSQQTRRGH